MKSATCLVAAIMAVASSAVAQELGEEPERFVIGRPSIAMDRLGERYIFLVEQPNTNEVRKVGFWKEPEWNPSYLELLKDEEMRSRMNLTDEQLERLTEIYLGLEEFSQVVVDDLNAQDIEFADLGRVADYSIRSIEAFADECDKEIYAGLLPHQQRELRSEVIRLRVENVGFSFYIEQGLAAHDLGLSGREARQFEESMSKAMEELQRSFAQIRKEADRKLIEKLTPTQRQRLEELIGPIDN